MKQYTKEELIRAKNMVKTIFQLGEEREYGCISDTWFGDDTQKLQNLRQLIIEDFVKIWFDEKYDRGEKDVNAISWIDSYSL